MWPPIVCPKFSGFCGPRLSNWAEFAPSADPRPSWGQWEPRSGLAGYRKPERATAGQALCERQRERERSLHELIAVVLLSSWGFRAHGQHVALVLLPTDASTSEYAINSGLVIGAQLAAPVEAQTGRQTGCGFSGKRARGQRELARPGSGQWCRLLAPLGSVAP